MPRKELSLMQSTNKTLKEGLKEFITYNRVKNLSSASLEYYESCYHKFTLFISEDTVISEITKSTVDQWILWLKNNRLASTTINTQLNGVRVMLYYFMELGYLGKFNIPKIKQEKPIKETYTKSEINILLEKPDIYKCQFTDYRDWVIINTLLGTGMRLRTLINIRIKDADIENHLLFYSTTKNRKQQIVPLSKTLTNVLSEYIQLRLKQTDLSDWLFCSRYGEKLTNNAVGHSLKKYNNRRGVMRQGVHMWRHTFAKLWIVEGHGDPFRLQKILGHSDLEVVKEYINLFSEDLAKDYDDFNPLELMQQKKRGSILKIQL